MPITSFLNATTLIDEAPRPRHSTAREDDRHPRRETLYGNKLRI